VGKITKKSNRSKITQPPLMMGPFVPIIPAAGKIQDEYDQEPNGIDARQPKTHIVQTEQKETIGSRGLTECVASGKEKNYTANMYEVQVEDIIEKGNPSVYR
jgi:hypothetical protein